jgi:hypothetical protein
MLRELQLTEDTVMLGKFTGTYGWTKISFTSILSAIITRLAQRATKTKKGRIFRTLPARAGFISLYSRPSQL